MAKDCSSSAVSCSYAPCLPSVRRGVLFRVNDSPKSASWYPFKDFLVTVPCNPDDPAFGRYRAEKPIVGPCRLMRTKTHPPPRTIHAAIRAQAG